MTTKKGLNAPSVVHQVTYNEDLVNTAAQYKHLPTPFMLTDLDIIKNNCRNFKAALPNLRLYYAVKAFYSTEIIESIAREVDGFDVASLKEIKDLLAIGIKPSRLNFSNPVKSSDAIKKAYRLGVKKFAFQSLSELAKLQLNAPGASVYVRVKLRDHPSFVPLSEKFGCDREEVADLLLYAKRVGLKPLGITFHVGSQLLDYTAWEESISLANSLMREVQSKGVDATEVNVGGGFPTQYFKGDPDIEMVAKHVNRSLDHTGNTAYAAEPGRYIVANSSVIVSKVIGVEHRNGQNWLFIDTGLFQSFLGALQYEVFPYQPISLSHQRSDRSMNSETIPYILTGPTCDSQDIISSKVMLPSDLALDDLLVFPNTGAYTVVYGSNFNGFSVPKSHFISKGKKI
jgi:ornithine decarboxylase